MSSKRIQLTLFIDAQQSGAFEAIRKVYNPDQYALIKSHITLCREDELEQIGQVLNNLAVLVLPHLTVAFGPVIRFEAGKGVLMPGMGENEPFHQLRKSILKGITETPRRHEPHITLIHPRNAACSDATFERIQQTLFPTTLIFRKISLIEQEIGKKWQVLQEFRLKDGQQDKLETH